MARPVRRRGIGMLLVLLLAAATAPAIATDLDDENLVPPTTTSVNDRGVIFRNAVDSMVAPNLHMEYRFICRSTSDPKCANGKWLQYQTFLAPCETAASMDCIESVSVKLENGTEAPATPSAVQPTLSASAFEPDPSRNLPAAHEAMLYDIPGAPHKNGIQYVVAIWIGDRTDEDHTPGTPYGSFQPSQMRWDIFAVKEVSGPYEKGVWNDAQGPDGLMGFRADWASNCAMVDDGKCWQMGPLPEGVTFTLKVRVKKGPPGWFFGRVTKPDLSIEKIDGGERWTVSAEPVRSPNVWGFVPKTQEIDAWLAENSVGRLAPASSPLFDESTSPATIVRVPSPMNMGNGFDSTGKFWSGAELSIKWLNFWMPLLGDKASSQPTRWSIRAIEPAEMNTSSRCFTDTSKVLGIVTTNAMIAVAGPPDFNTNTMALEYKVAAPHFKPNGKDLFLGTYDLVMRSEVARCLYGFSNAPVRASISVISANGESVTAVAVQREEKGWLQMGAYGFTFSAPTVAIKLTQATTPTTMPVTTPVTTKKITCKKGKTKKTFTGTTCPKGWKRA